MVQPSTLLEMKAVQHVKVLAIFAMFTQERAALQLIAAAEHILHAMWHHRTQGTL